MKEEFNDIYPSNNELMWSMSDTSSTSGHAEMKQCSTCLDVSG